MIRDPILNLIHSVIIGLLLYIVFRFILKMEKDIHKYHQYL